MSRRRRRGVRGDGRATTTQIRIPYHLPPGHAEIEHMAPLDPGSVDWIVAKVRGKLAFRAPVKVGTGGPIFTRLMELAKEHGRHLVVTAKLKDGTKRRYRGNGRRLL